MEPETKRRSFNEHLEEIMDNFDFDTVHYVMENVRPKIVNVEGFAKELLEVCYNESVEHQQDWNLTSAGFRAEYYYKDDVMRLAYEIDSWTTNVY